MSIATDRIAFFRAQWATRFVDTITATRMADRGTFNPTTLDYDAGTDTTVYSGAALIRPATDDDTALYGGEQVTGVGVIVYVPHDAGTFEVEDTINIVASTWDPDLVGADVRVVAVTYDSYQTRQRLVCRLDEGAGYG